MALQGPKDDFDGSQGDKIDDNKTPPSDIFFHTGKQIFDKIYSNLKENGFIISRRDKRLKGKKYTLEYAMAGASRHSRVAAGEVLKITINRDCIVTLSHDICMRSNQGDTKKAIFPDQQHSELRASLHPNDRQNLANLCETLITQIARLCDRPEICVRHIVLKDNPLKDILNKTNSNNKKTVAP